MSVERFEDLSKWQPDTSGPFRVERNGDFADVVGGPNDVAIIENVDWPEAKSGADIANRAAYALVDRSVTKENAP